MKSKKVKIIGIVLSLFLLLVVYILTSDLFSRYEMHSDAVFAGINDLLQSGNDINDYITHNQDQIDIIHYDLDINLFPEKEYIKGKAILTGILNGEDRNNLKLNFYDNLEISELKLNGQGARFEREGSSLQIFSMSQISDSFLVSINYSGTPHNIGMSSFSFNEKDSNYVVYTLNEPIYASTWFPCNDRPDDKALLDIKITNDEKYTSVSNGVLVDTLVVDGRKTYHWKTVYPISTYLITLNSGIYEKYSEFYISENDTIPLDYYVFPEDKKAAQMDFRNTKQMMKVLSELFGEYPFKNEKYGIIEFLWQSGAMEHQTLTGIGSNFVSGFNLFEDVLVHELAHHWWGNAVGPKTWKDIWLNEGFATYSEALYFEKLSGPRTLASTMYNNRFFDDTRLYNPENGLLAQTVYEKGAWVLHMLRRLVGDETFFQILKNYFEKFKYSNASTFDFIRISEETSGKDLTKFFDQWVLKGEDRVELYCKLESDDDFQKVRIKQNQAGRFEFPLDIKFLFNGNKSDTTLSYFITTLDTTIILNFRSKIKEIRVDPDNWLLMNQYN